MYIFGVIALKEEAVPAKLSFLVPVAYAIFRTKFVMQIGFGIACSLHIGEAFYALILCSRKGINSLFYRIVWFFYVLLFGVGSMRYLLALERQRPKST
jgi:hypothetical protein